ncbi:MAG: ROK family transcriptional regulator [Oscillospiraceae bacterium]
MMEQYGISKLDLKRLNRKQILRILKENGPTSRIDIAAKLDLTRAAVTIITTDMIEQGIIYEVGEYKAKNQKATRGRKKILLDINYHYKFVVGIVLEEKVASVGLTTLYGEVLDKRNLFIKEGMIPDDVADFLVQAVKQVISDNCLDSNSILGVGMGVHPELYSRANVEIENGEPNFEELRKTWSEKLQLPVIVNSSVIGTLCANIDFNHQSSNQLENVTLFQYGREVDFIYSIDSVPIKSIMNRTDCVSKMILDPYAKEVCPRCGKKGCLHNEVASESILRRIRNAYSAEKTPYLYEITKGDISDITGEGIVSAYMHGDKAITEIFNRVLDLMSILVNNVSVLTNSEKVILHFYYFESTMAFELLKQRLLEVCGKEVANKLMPSCVDYKHRFLSGCALAIRALFYEKGGFDI